MTRFLSDDNLTENFKQVWNKDLMKLRVLTVCHVVHGLPSADCSRDYGTLKKKSGRSRYSEHRSIEKLASLFCWYDNCWFRNFPWLFLCDNHHIFICTKVNTRVCSTFGRSQSTFSCLRGQLRMFLSISCLKVLHTSTCFREWFDSYGATAWYYASHTKTMLQRRKSVPRSSRQLDHTKTWSS